jgi:hypothetical protein
MARNGFARLQRQSLLTGLPFVLQCSCVRRGHVRNSRGRGFMTIMWPLVEWSAKLLNHGEREVVLGDLLEADENAWRGIFDIFGLVFRRQAGLWRDPRPWLAGFVVAMPCSYLLMIASFSVSCTYQRLVHHKVYPWHWPTGHEGFPLLLCHILLLASWSWSAGYVAGSISRRTLWASVALSALPFWSVLCMPVESACFLLFLPPAILGAWRAWHGSLVSRRTASLLAVTMTVLMISAWSNQALWVANWALVCPAWYLAATAWRSGKSRSDFGSLNHASAS